MNITVTNDLCNEVRDLREQLAREKADHDALAKEAIAWATQTTQLRHLLTVVHDAGRPHSHLCGCDQCAAFEAVRKELRGE